MENTQKKTGYPSIDKPWLKYYSEEAINAPLPKMTMYQYAYENNKEHLTDTAFRYFGAKISYGVFFDGVKKAANAFYALGVREGDIVTIMSMHTPETIMAIYGLNYIGAVANMVYMTLSEPEILETLRNTESKALLVLDVALEKVRKIKDEISVPVFVLSVADSMPLPLKIGYALKSKPAKDFPNFSSLLKGKAADAPLATNHAAPAVIVYTSGTTGKPKGVMLSSDNLNSLTHQYKHSGAEFNRGDTFYDVIPPFFGFGVGFGIHMPLCLGLTLILGVTPKVDVITKEFKKYKPDHFIAGPSNIRHLVGNLDVDLSFATTIGGGGESLSLEQEQEVNEKLKQHGFKGKYVTGYGMTEFSPTVSFTLNHIHKVGSLGIPLPRVTAKIVNPETENECQFGEAGEMCFCAPNTMLGYYKNPDATQAVVVIDDMGRRWLKTGDLGYCDEDGFLFFEGRIKRIYPVREKNGMPYKMFPQRIEEFFEFQANIESCAVIVQEDKERLHVPIAFVTCKSGADRDKLPQQLAAAARVELPEHSQPQAIYVIDTMPMTASGKVDYRALEREAEKLASGK